MLESYLYSLRIEKHFLAAYLKYPNLYPEVDNLISEYDFYQDVHSTIYCVSRNCYRKGEKFDKVLLAQKIKDLGINFKDDINIFDYIDNLYFSQITYDAALKTTQELIGFRIKRELHETAIKIQQAIKNNGSDPQKLIEECDRIYNEKISQYEFKQPEDVLKNAIEIVEERGNNPIEEIGLITPFKEFNRLYGGLRPGNIYAFVSRPKHGKSTLLNDLALNCCIINKDCKALVLDTEMNTIDIKFRNISAITQIPSWYLETGNYKKNNEFYKKFIENKEKIKKFQNYVSHMNVSGKPIDEVLSIIKRWYYKTVGRGNQAIIVYDYIKITGESEYNKQEYQILGDKINKIKEISLELNIPILTACQLNRSAEEGIDDSRSIAQSDRLQWFGSFVGIFRRKTLDEITEDGLEFGTHKLIELAARFHGKDSKGHFNRIKIKDHHTGKIKYVDNYINYKVNNFFVEEKGSLRDIIDNHNQIHQLKDSDNNDGHLI